MARLIVMYTLFSEKFVIIGFFGLLMDFFALGIDPSARFCGIRLQFAKCKLIFILVTVKNLNAIATEMPKPTALQSGLPIGDTIYFSSF